MAFVRDDVFYIEPVTILVEDTLFRIDKRRLIQESEVFRDMFSLPIGLDTGPQLEGSCDERPLKLEQVDKIEFKRLLAALFSSEDMFKEQRSNEELLSISKLARQFSFVRLETMSIEDMDLHAMETFDIIRHAQAYNIEDWLQVAISRLVARDKPLSIDEARILGLEVTVEIFHRREMQPEARNPPYVYSKPVRSFKRF